MFKIIAIGNQLMGDDGIALAVLNTIQDQIKKIDPTIEIICGETDYMYCLDNIHKGDVVIIMDSSFLGEAPGTVEVTSLNKLNNKLVYSSQHQVSLPDLIYKYHQDILVYTIGIEVAEIDYQYGLSNTLKTKFKEICIAVLDKIKMIIKEQAHA